MVYVSGEFMGSVDFDPGPGVEQYTCTFIDCFLSAFDSNGNFCWARTWYARAYGLATYGTDRVYVVGYFVETVDFDPGPGEEIHYFESHHGYLSVFDSSGNFLWVRVWGGDYSTHAFAVDVDGFSNIYVTGIFQVLVDFDPGPGTDYHTADSYDPFLSKLSLDGDFLWARTWMSDGQDAANDVVVDVSGNPYVAGGFTKKLDFDPGPGIDEHTGGGAFLIKLKPDGYW